MKLSARNVLAGTITKVTKGSVNSEVELTLTSGEKVIAGITNGSVEALGLKDGKNAFAIVKASWVILGTDLHNAKLSARNILCGTVSKIQEGAVNGEVALKLGGGAALTAIVTNESIRSLGLKDGGHACAAFKASSVIIGTE
jgi:molybdate transport system regulatory protein